MPSGSKKRKASKRPKPGEPPTPQGEPPELETGLEDPMEKDGVEGSLSPKAAMEEANQDEGVEENTELSREASQERAELEEASTPTPDEVRLIDPSISQAEVPRAEAPEGIQVEGDAADDNIAAQGEPTPQIEEEIDTPSPAPIEREDDALVPETKPEVAPIAAPTELEPDANHAEAPPTDIVREVDEIEPKEEAPNEIGSEPREAQTENEPGNDEVPVEVDEAADMAGEERKSENDTTPDAILLEVEPEVVEAPVEMNRVMDDAPVDGQPENDEATVARDLDTDAASATIEPEGTDDATAETAADTNEGPTSVQSEINEAIVETDAAPENLEADPAICATPVDAQPETDEAPVVGDLVQDSPSTDMEPTASADIDSEAIDWTSVETAAETAEGPGNAQSEMEEAIIPRQLETEAGEVEIAAATAENELEKETSEAEGDASVEESLQESQSDAIKYKNELETETGVSSAAGPEPEMETTNREAESETDSSPIEMKPEVDATLDDAGKDAVVQPETKSEDEVAHADIEPEPKERDLADVEREVELENITEACALKDIEIEPERPIEAEAGPATQDAGELEESAEPAELAVAEISEGSKEDSHEVVETNLEADTETEGGTLPVNELETEAVVPTEVENIPEFKSDEKSSTETESNKQYLVEVESVQSNVDQYDQQAQECERGTESGVEALDLPAAEATEAGVEAPELPETEIDQVEIAAVAAVDGTDLADAAVSSLPDGEAAANVGTPMPASEQENTGNLEEREAISPSGEVLQGEAREAAHEDIVVESEQDAVDGEQNESKDEIVELETEVVDDSYGEDKAAFGEANRTLIPCEPDLGIELPSEATLGGEVTLTEETLEEEPVTKLFQPAADKEYLTMDPSVVNVSSGDTEMIKHGLHTTLSPQSEMLSECESKDVLALEHEVDLDSLSRDEERDVEEEEAASSTVAEAGSVLNDFDEIAQQSPIDFPVEQDTDVPESSEFDDTDTLSSKAPELMETGSTEPIDGECREIVNTPSHGVEDDQVEEERSAAAYIHKDDNKASPLAVGDGPKDEVEWKNVQDLEASSKQEEVSPESAKADSAATSLPSSVTLPVDEHLCEGGDVLGKEVNIEEEGEDGEKNGEGAAPSTFGIVPALEYLAVADKELMSTALPSDTDGQSSSYGLDASIHDLVTPVETTGIQDNAAVGNNEPEIGTVEANDLNAAVYILPKKEPENNYYNGMPLLSASPGRDIQDVQAFRQENTQETSLPVIVPAQNVKQRALEEVNLKGNERQSEGMALQRRTKEAGCCGLFDLLLGKNQ